MFLLKFRSEDLLRFLYVTNLVVLIPGLGQIDD
jgi:hypothetical protein